jgi:tetratricopeptide (TPR) repeat protein
MNEQHATLMALESLSGLSNAEALQKLGLLVDLSHDVGSIEGLRKAIALADDLSQCTLTPSETADLHYTLGNAWGNIKVLKNVRVAWDSEELEQEIYQFRLAVGPDPALSKPRRVQSLTNLANSLSDAGRVIEAIELWEQALRGVPGYGMTVGNRGYGLYKLAYGVPDRGHAAYIMAFARQDLARAVKRPLETEGAAAFFKTHLARAESVLGDAKPPTAEALNAWPMGRSQQERRYRQWCLKHRLFLNPLNDLGAYAIGARDRLALPTMVRPIGEGPIFHGLFNQLKQEFTAARFLYFEGISGEKAHFADREVYQLNTLDYPSYSIHVEKMKAAFRIAYSMLDKIAFFVNAYYEFEVPSKNVSFRSIWYTKGEKKKGLRPDIEVRPNWPLKGLFWVGKDLSEDRPEFVASMNPDSQQLVDIRNHLEHKYLKLHEPEWHINKDVFPGFTTDTLALSVYRGDFSAKTLRMLKLVRSALLYLVMSVRFEESRRKEKDKAPAGPIVMDVWEDRWKR